MNGESMAAVSAAVVALVQLIKWGGLPDKLGPLVVLGLSALGVALWVYSQADYVRADLFSYFANWVVVATSAAGVFGFTRATASAVINATPPPESGAGSDRTQKPAEADAAEARSTYLKRTQARVRNSFTRPAPPPARAPDPDDTPPGVG